METHTVSTRNPIIQGRYDPKQIYSFNDEGYLQVSTNPRDHQRGYRLHHHCKCRDYTRLPENIKSSGAIFAYHEFGNPYLIPTGRQKEFTLLGDMWCRFNGGARNQVICGRILICGTAETIDKLVTDADIGYAATTKDPEVDLARSFSVPIRKDARDAIIASLATRLECQRHPTQKMSECVCSLRQNWSLEYPEIQERLDKLPEDWKMLCIGEFLTETITKYDHNDIGLPGGKPEYNPITKRFETPFQCAIRETTEETTIKLDDKLIESGIKLFGEMTGLEPKLQPRDAAGKLAFEKYYCVALE